MIILVQINTVDLHTVYSTPLYQDLEKYNVNCNWLCITHKLKERWINMIL